ncbi:hypothetical protein ACLCDV_11020 [Sphingobacterium sp. Lzh-3]|uniref:hypothetical protein n=1 Tax=Sphingobacterium sp. Lzh-3 TaxID=3382150 RepID=UPI00398D35B6
MRNTNNTYIFIYIEEYRPTENLLLFDFVDNQSFMEIKTFIRSDPQKRSSMVLIRNYHGKKLEEGAVYRVSRNKMLEIFLLESMLEIHNSYLIGYSFEYSKVLSDLFSAKQEIITYYLDEKSNLPLLTKNFPVSDASGFNVRNVGHANWNEVEFEHRVKIVYDIGSHLHSTKQEIDNLFADKYIEYKKNLPMLIISHWDKDHYHALLGLESETIQQCFSTFIFPEHTPNATSKRIVDRIRNSLPKNSIHYIKNLKKAGRKVESICEPNCNIQIYRTRENYSRNKSGILLCVKSSFASVIFSGDADYSTCNLILQELKYYHTNHLVVPHHGGKAGAFKYVPHNSVNFGKAIISTGTSKFLHFKNHLNKTKDDLKTKTKFQIIEVEEQKKDVHIKLKKF